MVNTSRSPAAKAKSVAAAAAATKAKISKKSKTSTTKKAARSDKVVSIKSKSSNPNPTTTHSVRRKMPLSDFLTGQGHNYRGANKAVIQRVKDALAGYEPYENGPRTNTYEYRSKEQYYKAFADTIYNELPAFWTKRQTSAGDEFVMLDDEEKKDKIVRMARDCQRTKSSEPKATDSPTSVSADIADASGFMGSLPLSLPGK